LNYSLAGRRLDGEKEASVIKRYTNADLYEEAERGEQGAISKVISIKTTYYEKKSNRPFHQGGAQCDRGGGVD